jgi:hypothetical protein
MEDQDTKLASNFELNFLKLGKHRIQLVKGDRFTSNGHTFDYRPSTAENKGKGRRERWYGRHDEISAKKYQKDVLRADNIKLIIDRPLSPHSPADSEYNVRNRWREWEVQYAYEVPEDDKEELVIMVVEKSYAKDEWAYRVEEFKVERETKETYFLEKNHPVTYHSKIPKGELNKVFTDRGGMVYHIIGQMEHYHENEIAIFNRAEENMRQHIVSAKEAVVKAETNLDNVLKLKHENGF